MADCTYRFTDASGNERVIEGQAAFKAYLLDGGLQHLLPSFANRMPGAEDLNALLEQKIFSDFDAAVREYSSLPDTKSGKLLDTDQARELSPEYRQDRSRAPEVHEAASAFTQRAFEERMANAPNGSTVVFMAGGGGAGKSSAEHLLSTEMDRANTILDGTLSSFDKASRNVQLALDNNQSVIIAYVYREPVEALRNGVLTRAMKRGRTVTIDALVKGHAGSSEVVRRLQDQFGDNPNFIIKVIDNSHGPDGAVVSTLDAVPVVDREGLKEKFQNATDEEFQAGRISEVVYRATSRPYDTRATDGGTRQAAGIEPRNRPEVQGRGELGEPRYSVKQTDTPAFKRWFGDSEVVDAQGNPLVVYHGTRNDFGTFDFSRGGEVWDTSDSRGVMWFSSYIPRANAAARDAAEVSAETDEDWEAKAGANVMPVYLRAEKLYRLTPAEVTGDTAKAIDRAKARGYDGVVMPGEMGGQDFAVFAPEQIKSATGNVGTFSPESADIRLSQRQQRGRETEGWILSRDELGRFRFGAGAKAYRYAADVANAVLDKVNLKPVSPELSRALRKMKVEIEKAQNLTVDVAKQLKDLPAQEREMISDIIEGELKRGAKPPKHVLELAASMQSIMSEQTAELVRLGMLSPEAAGRWDGKYLPRFYEQKLGDETKAWMKAVKGLLGRKRTMQGITGNSLKARGMFENIAVEDLPEWKAEGWEVRDDSFDPAVDTEITVWRDFTRAERDDMGEIRDAMFRFVMGYNKSQRDISLGRLYQDLADNFASRTEQPGFVKVPDTKIEDTMVPRYGKLANKWVPKEVLDQLSSFDSSMQNDLTKMYLKGLSMWKEGKTVLNPVAHANNVLSNLTMAHFAGVSYWDAHKYIGAIRDLVKSNAMVEEAREAGLFGGTFNRAELVKALPEELKAMAQITESAVGRNVDRVWNALSLFLRKPMGVAYDAEDQFFRYLIYRDARNRGLDVDDSVDYAQKYIFTYDDLPKTVRVIRDMPVGLPFFSYTYKAIPALANTALEHPERYAAPAIALYVANAAMYAMAASLGGGDDEDWWTVIRRYMTDPDFRAKAKAMEEQERKVLPEWMKGASLSLGTQKTIRLGMDDVTNLPVFLDVSRIFPGGDLFDAHNNAGGIPLLAPITPNNPVLTTAAAMLFNKDTFRNKEIVTKTDTPAEAAQKRAAWAWKQVSPAIAIGNTHFERAMNVVANMTGQPVNVGLAEFTGIGADGLPVQPKYAAMQTVGIKARPIDLDTSEKIQASQTKAMIRELELEMRKLTRLESKGAITSEAADREKEKLREKRGFLRQGLTVTGEEKD